MHHFRANSQHQKDLQFFPLKLPISQHKSKNVMKNVENRFKVQMLAHSIDMCDWRLWSNGSSQPQSFGVGQHGAATSKRNLHLTGWIFWSKTFHLK